MGGATKGVWIQNGRYGGGVNYHIFDALCRWGVKINLIPEGEGVK